MKADGTAEMRTVKTGTTIDTMTVVEDGLKPGEQVVTDGQLRIVPGAKVQVRTPGQGGRGGQGQGGQDQGGNQGQSSDQSGQGKGGQRRGGGNQ